MSELTQGDIDTRKEPRAIEHNKQPDPLEAAIMQGMGEDGTLKPTPTVQAIARHVRPLLDNATEAVAMMTKKLADLKHQLDVGHDAAVSEALEKAAEIALGWRDRECGRGEYDSACTARAIATAIRALKPDLAG
jgi:hypothetical protein